MGWREVVHGYEEAEWNRSLEHYRTGGEEMERIARFGTREIEVSYRRFLDRAASSLQEPAAVGSYVLVEESETGVLVEVPKPEFDGEDRARYRLIPVGRDWKIDQIYMQCFACNSALRLARLKRPRTKKPAPGQCWACSGTGKQVVLPGCLDFLLFPLPGERKVRCTKCGGSGTCEHCEATGMPGWIPLWTFLGSDPPIPPD